MSQADLECIGALSISQLKQVIDAAGLSRDDCLEVDDLRDRALEAAAKGAPLPEVQAVPTPAGPDPGESMPEEKLELLTHWSETALRIQLLLLGKHGIAADAPKEVLVDEYWQHLLEEGSAYGEHEEQRRRWLRVLTLDKESQAIRFIEAVTNQHMPPSSTLQAWLRSGVVLCDAVNVILKAVGRRSIEPWRGDAADADATPAQAARSRAKQIENIGFYIGACRKLKVDAMHTFEPEDLYEARSLPSVVKNVHALAQQAHKFMNYRGPQMGPVLRKERSWVQRASVVSHDWRTKAGVQTTSQPKAQVAVTQEMRGNVHDDRFLETVMRSATICEEHAADVEPLTPLEELAQLQQSLPSFVFVETAGRTDEEAALAWVEGVLGGPLAPSLGAALKTGSVLCRLIEAVEPGALKDAKLLTESAKPFEQMAAIDGYLKACQRLGVTQATFITVDLHEGRDLKAVTNQLWALALLARTRPKAPFLLRGPHLGTEAQQATARQEKEKTEKRIEKLNRALERERKRVEKALTTEEIEDERRLIEQLKREAEMRAKTEAERRAQQAVDRASRTGFLYKRGGVAKVWRKRWFAIADGQLSYYMTVEDWRMNKMPLGTLFLANASARPPTDPRSKGKYQSTCMRLDLDPEVQVNERERRDTRSASADATSELPAALPAPPPAADMKRKTTLSSLMPWGGGREASRSGSRSLGRRGSADGLDGEGAFKEKDKWKYLLAAESIQGLTDWMEAVEFWSKKLGSEARRSVIASSVTADEIAAARAQAEHTEVARSYLTNLDDDEDDEDEDEDAMAAAAAAAARAATLAALEIPGAPPEKQELMSWSAMALIHQMERMGGELPAAGASAGKRELVEAYWTTLVRDGKEFDEVTRRWLVVPKEDVGSNVARTEMETEARLWLECLTERTLDPGPLQPQLRSGEVLCDAVNWLCPGIVPKIARAELLGAMSENRRAARMRENIGQYVDACAELGVAQKELFITADLFDNKHWKAVLKNIHALARLAHYDVSGFVGPHIGIRKHRQGGFIASIAGGASRALGRRGSADAAPSGKAAAADAADEAEKARISVTSIRGTLAGLTKSSKSRGSMVTVEEDANVAQPAAAEERDRSASVEVTRL